MGVEQPLFLHEDVLPAIPSGWVWSRSDSVVIQRKPGKLFDTSTVAATGAVPVLNQSESGVLGYHDEEPGVVASAVAPVVTFANHTCAMRLVKHPFSAIQNIFPKVGKQGVCDTVWFYYALLGRVRTNEYKGHHPLFRDAFVPVPPLAVQRRIASILSTYDDLIENNTRRIAILEEMARRIYEEWFVRFRFPGHEGVRMVESELGMVPEGWRTDVLAGVCEPKTGIQTGPFGSQLHKADYSEVGVPVLMPKDLIEFRIEEDSVARVPEATAESLKRHRMRPGDIAYGRRGDIGRRAFIMAHQAGWLCGTGCLRIRPDSKKINGWYVFNYLGQDSVVGLIAGRAHGVTMPNLNAQLLESVPVVCPPRELQDQFERISFPMAELRESLIAKNANLRTTRDLLLPKLISGELGVSAMTETEALAA